MAVELVPKQISILGRKAASLYRTYLSGRGASTRQTYAREIRDLLDWCFEEKIALKKLQRRQVERYLAVLGTRKGPSSVDVALVGMRGYWRLLENWKIVSRNPFQGMSVKRTATKISNEEGDISLPEHYDELVESFDADRVIDLRDWAMMDLLVFTFMRPTELAAMKVRDYLDHESGKFIQIGRRWVPCHSQVSSSLTAFRKVLPANTRENDRMFTSILKDGRFTGKGFDDRVISALVRKRSIDAGLPYGSCLSWRGMGIRAYLSNRGSMVNLSRWTDMSYKALSRYFDGGAETTNDIECVDI